MKRTTNIFFLDYYYYFNLQQHTHKIVVVVVDESSETHTHTTTSKSISHTIFSKPENRFLTTQLFFIQKHTHKTQISKREKMQQQQNVAARAPMDPKVAVEVEKYRDLQTRT